MRELVRKTELGKATEYIDAETPVKAPDTANCRAAIFALEDKIKQMPQAEIEVIHRFAPGVYLREMRVPAGVMLTGAVHRHEHMSIFLEGKMMVHDGNGKAVEIEAPIIERAMPGIKRAGVALEDVRWITVHPTELTDLDEIEAHIVTNDPAEAELIANGGMIGKEIEDLT